jgi:hypothetical protein
LKRITPLPHYRTRCARAVMGITRNRQYFLGRDQKP